MALVTYAKVVNVQDMTSCSIVVNFAKKIVVLPHWMAVVCTYRNMLISEWYVTNDFEISR